MSFWSDDKRAQPKVLLKLKMSGASGDLSHVARSSMTCHMNEQTGDPVFAQGVAGAGGGEESNYRKIVDQAHEGIWTIDARGITTFVNHRMSEMLGYSEAEMVGRSHTDFMFESDRPHGDVQMDLRRMGTRETWDQRYRRKDGSALWTIASCCPLYDGEKFLGALGMFTDITARKELERALQHSETRFRATFENAAVGMAHVGLDGRWLLVNRRLCQLLGYTHAELMPLSFRDLTHPDDLEQDLALAGQVHRGEIPTYTMEKRYRRKNVDYFWGELTVSLLRDERGEPLNFISVIKDISERKRVTDELQASRAIAVDALRSKDQFFAALSHELRTPLNPVMLLTGDAIADPATPDHLREAFQTIESAVMQQTRLIDDLLDLARVTGGKLALHRESMELRRFLQSIVVSLRADASRKGIVLELRGVPGPVLIDADEGRMRQVFANVVGNALKFTPQNGSVAVELSIDSERREAVVAVIDTGLGMSAEEQGRIFQRFSQGEHARSAPGKFGGLGLGLTIAKGLVEQHGGTMSAYSAGSHQGSTFTLRFPLAE
jgi:PAS domain S-box-containing protein